MKSPLDSSPIYTLYSSLGDLWEPGLEARYPDLALGRESHGQLAQRLGKEDRLLLLRTGSGLELQGAISRELAFSTDLAMGLRLMQDAEAALPGLRP